MWTFVLISLGKTLQFNLLSPCCAAKTLSIGNAKRKDTARFYPQGRQSLIQGINQPVSVKHCGNCSTTGVRQLLWKPGGESNVFLGKSRGGCENKAIQCESGEC